jgi:hypothetical protein
MMEPAANQRLSGRAVATLLCCAALCASGLRAQEEGTTPGAIPNPGTYQGSMEQQRRDAESAQQVQQQNEQMQQRLNENYRYYAPGGAGGVGAGGGASGHAVPPLNSKPLLPADKNPLLGRWQQTAGRPMDLGLLKGMPGASEMVSGALGGGCQSIFGKGRVAFTPTTYNWVAPDGHEEVLNHVEYRADGANVIVIPNDPAPLPLIFGFPNHDHAVVAFLGCTMQRVTPGAKPTQASSQTTPANSQSKPAALNVPAGQAVLDLNVGATVAGKFSPVPAGTSIWLTPQNPDANLVKAGFTPDSGGQPIEKLFAACKIGHGGTMEDCKRGMQAMLSGALGVAATDDAGHARTGAVPPGRYYVVGFVPYQGHSLMWHMPVDMRPGANSVTLGPENGSISH